jgi:hypothetical protein
MKIYIGLLLTYLLTQPAMAQQLNPQWHGNYKNISDQSVLAVEKNGDFVIANTSGEHKTRYQWVGSESMAPKRKGYYAFYIGSKSKSDLLIMKKGFDFADKASRTLAAEISNDKFNVVWLAEYLPEEKSMFYGADCFHSYIVDRGAIFEIAGCDYSERKGVEYEYRITKYQK